MGKEYKHASNKTAIKVSTGPVCNCIRKYFGNVKAEESKKLKTQFIHCLSSQQKGSMFPIVSDQ
jgi:hypothetical protein